MIYLTNYSLGEEVELSTLHWYSDWNYSEVLGEEYEWADEHGALGFYGDMVDENLYYYVDLKDNKIVCVIEYSEEEDTDPSEEWSENFL